MKLYSFPPCGRGFYAFYELFPLESNASGVVKMTGYLVDSRTAFCSSFVVGRMQAKFGLRANNFANLANFCQRHHLSKWPSSKEWRSITSGRPTRKEYAKSRRIPFKHELCKMLALLGAKENFFIRPAWQGLIFTRQIVYERSLLWEGSQRQLSRGIQRPKYQFESQKWVLSRVRNEHPSDWLILQILVHIKRRHVAERLQRIRTEIFHFSSNFRKKGIQEVALFFTSLQQKKALPYHKCYFVFQATCSKLTLWKNSWAIHSENTSRKFQKNRHGDLVIKSVCFVDQKK